MVHQWTVPALKGAARYRVQTGARKMKMKRTALRTEYRVFRVDDNECLTMAILLSIQVQVPDSSHSKDAVSG